MSEGPDKDVDEGQGTDPIDVPPVLDVQGTPTAGPPPGRRRKRDLVLRVARKASGVVRRASGDMEMARVPLARKVVERAKDTLDRVPLEAAAERLAKIMSDPRAAAALQTVMKTVGSATMTASFTREPNARLLFDFAEWCEHTIDRGEVMAVLMNDALEPGGAVFEMVSPVSRSAGSSDVIAAIFSTPVTDSLVSTIRGAQQGLMRTLAILASRATDIDDPSPEASLEELASHFRGADLPERYLDLADLTLGLDRSEPPAVPSKRRGASEAKALVVRRVRSMALVKSLPPGSRFVVSAYLTFVQAYLSRNLVDSLPNVMAKLRDELEQEERQLHEEDGLDVIDQGDGQGRADDTP